MKEEPTAQPGTREAIIEAALKSLKEVGFSGATARAIARTGGFNQALIFYHFGTVRALLLEALDRTSSARLEAYRSAVGDATSIEELVRIARGLAREDVEEGHLTVAAEMIAGGVADAELQPEIAKRIRLWVDFAEGIVRSALAETPLADLVPDRALAFGIVAYYCGVNLISRLDADAAQIDELFGAALPLASMISPLMKM